jgi:hypothetical protein
MIDDEKQAIGFESFWDRMAFLSFWLAAYFGSLWIMVYLIRSIT